MLKKIINYSEKDNDGIIFLLTDLTKDAAFKSINPYLKAKLDKGRHIVTGSYLFTIRMLSKGSNYVIYEAE